LPLCLTPLTSRGDIVHLKNGGRIEGRIVRQDEKVCIEFRGGSIDLKTSDISFIEKKPLPEDIFPGRLRQVYDDADACVKLAQWALEKNLEKEYVQALRTALLVDTEHKKARTLLRKYKLHRAKLPYNKEACRKILADLGKGFRVLRSDHYRIGYNCDDIFAETTAERLEKLYEEFIAFFEERSFEPIPISDRLEVVLFDSEQEYQQHARNISNEMSHTSGFYSGKTGRCYFYDSISHSNSSYRNNREQLQKHHKKLKEIRNQVYDNSNPDMYYVFTDKNGQKKKLNHMQMIQELNRQEQHLKKEFEKLGNFYRNKNISVTIHEGAHQLSYNCGIHSSYFKTPMWLVEGLAVYFETPGQDQWRQPGLLHHNHIKTFKAKYLRKEHIALEKLITQDSLLNPSQGQHHTQNSYAAAWALFYYLVDQKHDAMFDYIFNLSLRISNKSYTARERRKDFEHFFGNLDELEKNWIQYIINLE